MPWVFRGLRDGVVTTNYPRRADPYQQQFRAAVAVRDPDAAGDVSTLCPSAAIGRDTAGAVTLDRGRCILCGRCVAARPDAFGWVAGADIARLTRTGVVVPSDDDENAVDRVRAELRERTAALGRSVHIRHVDGGSDGAEEWEVQALLNPVYDVHRLGIFFTASPRHADILLVTGAGARGMAAPLARTLEAMARPVVVIAVGADAVGGGLISPSYATAGGVGEMLPVDVWVPGSPPSPFSLLHAILLALGRLPEQSGPTEVTG